MAIQAFVDDSRDGEELLILAACITPSEKWAKFADEWSGLLTIKPPWKALKMSEIAMSNDVVRWERAEWHYRLIEKYVDFTVSMILPIPALNTVINKLGLNVDWANPYVTAFRMLIKLVADLSPRMGITQPIDFIFDTQSEGRKALGDWEANFADFPEHMKATLQEQPIFRNDERFMPLQAADMVAWLTRKSYLRHGTVRGIPFFFPDDGYPLGWKEKRKINNACYELDEPFLEELLLSQLAEFLKRGEVSLRYPDGRVEPFRG
jgi:hypothetical protein